MCISQICLSVLLFFFHFVCSCCLFVEERKKWSASTVCVYAIASVCTPAVVNEFERSNASPERLMGFPRHGGNGLRGAQPDTFPTWRSLPPQSGDGKEGWRAEKKKQGRHKSAGRLAGSRWRTVSVRPADVHVLIILVHVRDCVHTTLQTTDSTEYCLPCIECSWQIMARNRFLASTTSFTTSADLLVPLSLCKLTGKPCVVRINITRGKKKTKTTKH